MFKLTLCFASIFCLGVSENLNKTNTVDNVLTADHPCKTADDLGLKNCDEAQVPETQGWSGGWCLASMAEAGWIRSSAINPIMGLVLGTDVAQGILPMAVGTNSGGSMFGIRFFTMRYFNIETKWSYPCYLLQVPYSQTCYFHSPFGDISSECYADTFNIIGMATTLVYGPLFLLYGGPMGVAATYALVYFPFISSLPLSLQDTQWDAYNQKFVLFNTKYGMPSNWLVAHTLVSPKEASQSEYSYGFDSYVSRSTNSYSVNAQGAWAVTPNPGNITVVWVATGSANTQTGFIMMPFSWAGKSWDGLSAASVVWSPALKLFSMMLSYVMVQRLVAKHQIMNVNPKIDPTTAGKCDGKAGCPVMDGGFTDNGPITPVVSAAAQITPNRPSWLLSVGAASTMDNVEYLMGLGPLRIWTMAGVNVCPFVEGGMCSSIAKTREFVVSELPSLSSQAYYAVGNAFQIFRPQVQLLSPFCGDPLTYDTFKGACIADSVCDMMATIIPSTINKVPFTQDTYTLVFVLSWLQPSPVSNRFVTIYIPEQMLALPYYDKMASWFPNFDAISSGKGGMAFTTTAGNSFMDFMTFLNIRLVSYLFNTKVLASLLTGGHTPECQFDVYTKVNQLTYNAEEFVTKEKLDHLDAGGHDGGAKPTVFD